MHPVYKNNSYTIEDEQVFVYKIPLKEEETDGTLTWNHTVLVLVLLTCENHTGVGYTYANKATGTMIQQQLFPIVHHQDPMAIEGLWKKMYKETRNLGRPGITSFAIAAIDNALWDLKAKLLQVPLCILFGQVNTLVPIYASGGFISQKGKKLKTIFQQWKQEGHTRFKMKIGGDLQEDLKRIQIARKVIGEDDLFVDANGAYFPKEACAIAHQLTKFNISWFEEPVTSDNIKGLSFVRKNGPASLRIAAGEYGFDLTYFLNLLSSQAVDVLQADATRCGITGFIKAHTLCKAFHLPFSAHCAPSLHLHPSLSLENLIHIEYFIDHVRIERELFDGFPEPLDGNLQPDLSRPGLGLKFKFTDAQQYQIT